VAAFAYRQPVAVMEANVKRVLHRIFAQPKASEKELWENAALLLDAKNPYDYNQAMMDIGAMVCTKANPQCHLCPASVICEGKSSPQSYPAAKIKPATPVRRKNIAVVRDSRGRIYAEPRHSRFLGGMYHFSEMPQPQASFTVEGKKLELANAAPLGLVRQVYSHFTLEAQAYLVEYGATGEGKHWHAPEALPALPWSQAELKILGLLEKLPVAA
jgi:A/G-specific adenine glycosylase